MSKKTKKSKKNNKSQSSKPMIEEVILFSSVGFSLLLSYTFLAENNGGFLGSALKSLFTGLFGTGAFALPVVITAFAVYYFLNPKNVLQIKKYALLITTTYIISLVFLHTITKNTLTFESFIDYYSFNSIENGNPYIFNGGSLGALIGNIFITVIGNFGTYLFIFISYAIIFVLFTNKSLAKILGNFGINTTKIGINKTKEASDKISEYTESIKVQREEKIKLKNKKKELKLKEKKLQLNEKELQLKEKETLTSEFKKPIPNKKLLKYTKKECPKSVANSFIDKDLKNKSLKVPKGPSLFIIKEREEKNKTISLVKDEVNYEEVRLNNKFTATKKSMYFNKPTHNDTNKKYTLREDISHKEEVEIMLKQEDITDVTPQQEKVNAFYEEIKDNFTSTNNVEKDIDDYDYYKENTAFEVPYIKNSNVINEVSTSDVSVDDNFNIVSKDSIPDDLSEKINNVIVEDNIIHGLFNYVEDNSPLEDNLSNEDLFEDLSYEIEEDIDLYEDDFDLIEELEEESKIFDEINKNLNENYEDNIKKDTLNKNSSILENKIDTQNNKTDFNINNKSLIPLDEYTFPSIDILTPKEYSDKGLSDVEIQENSLKLEETLKSFGVTANVVNVSRGPTVTRYEIEPGIGVKVSKIANLVDDLSLSLASSGIRIQAPIPNKPYVGIEVPNKVTESVLLREVIDSEAFRNFKSKLAFGIGKDIGGDTVIFDIGKMPHVLVAGATGSGKSVCVNTLITSLIYKARPDEVKLLMIDPKVVELSIYNGIPHLLIPVVTDPKKANSALNWAVREMERRYSLFADNNVRNLDGYNDLAIDKEYDEILPRIVVIIDELADLMMTAAKEVEDSICRLAQKARAAGIHLIIATQRPSVDVITGLIKANIPTRMAFAVSSGIDSRTILDTVGAERLLGRGDMLFLPYGSNEPTRVQGAFISDKEVENIVDYLSKYKTPVFSEEIINTITSTSNTDNQDDELDDLFIEIVDFIIEKQKASASMLQSKFRIGFNRASRIIEQLEDREFIGPSEGSKARKILINRNEWSEIRDNF